MTAPQQTILYVEDDPTWRMVVERTLVAAGYRVLIAPRGLDGIDIARREEPDLILTDINLPDMNGHEIATRLRSEERFHNTPIVALSAELYEEHHAVALAAGLTGFLSKPSDVDTLREKIEYFLTGGHDVIDSAELAVAQTEYVQEIAGHIEGKMRELEDVNLRLRRMDKMKQSFIQVTAHELRTPLTLVYGYTRLLEDTPTIQTLMQSDDEVDMLIVGLVQGAQRMQEVVEEVLTVSRIMNRQIDLSLSETDPGEIVENTLSGYQSATSQRKITVHFKRSEWPSKMWADSALLALTFDNLVSNAIKYTPDGGNIYVRAKADDSNIHIEVRDTGIGVPPGEHESIFESFSSISDPQQHSTSKTAFGGGGLGLGLAICKGIIEAHQGKIWVESTARDPETLPGSTFKLELPLVTKDQLLQ